MTHLLGPADVGHVDEAVDAVFDTDEHTEFGDVLDDAFEDGAFRILFGHQFPGIGTNLLHAQADALLLAVHTQDDDFDFVTGVHHLGRMTQLAGPGHFGDVKKSVCSAQIDECTEICNVLNCSFNCVANMDLLH